MFSHLLSSIELSDTLYVVSRITENTAPYDKEANRNQQYVEVRHKLYVPFKLRLQHTYSRIWGKFNYMHCDESPALEMDSLADIFRYIKRKARSSKRIGHKLKSP
jgi:hypothetical protein